MCLYFYVVVCGGIAMQDFNGVPVQVKYFTSLLFAAPENLCKRNSYKEQSNLKVQI